MGLLGRLRRSQVAARENRTADDAVTRHLTEFVQTRRGVEAYIEQATQMNPPTILLVAWDGEWTRRRIPGPTWGHKFAEHLTIPGYDAGVVGYPQRMRDWNARARRRG